MSSESQRVKYGYPPQAGQRWRVTLPLAVARWLAGQDGPLSVVGGPGCVEHLGDGVVRLDRFALLAMSGLPDDGRVTWDEPAPRLWIGDTSWLLVAERPGRQGW